MTPEAPDTAAPASQDPAPRSRWALGLLVLGGLMLAGCLYLVASAALSDQPIATVDWVSPPRPTWLDQRVGRIPLGLAPDAQEVEFRLLFDEARQLADEHAVRAGQAARWSRYADWLSFALSSLIMILAGYFGRLPESGGDATAAAHALQAAEEKKHRKRKGRRATPRSRFAVAVGLVAALAATGSGASDRLRSSAEHSLNSAKSVGDAIIKASRAGSNLENEAGLLEALESLRQTMRSHPL